MLHKFAPCTAFILALFSCVLAYAAPARVDIASHMPTERPSLFITRAEADAILARAEQDPAYQKAMTDGILANAQAAYKALSPETLSIAHKEDTHPHQRVISNLQNLALGYLFSGKPEYARRAADVMLEYASFYPDITPKRKSAGRLTSQTLNEAMVMVQLAWVYDIIAPSLTQQEADTIETRLLRPAAELLTQIDRGKSNWQTWHNAALAALGLTLREPAYVERAVYGPSGFIFQRDNSINTDGIWYELSISYHDFTMHAVTLLLEACARAGINLYQLPESKELIEALYLAPIYYSYSNFKQAPFHDAHPTTRLNSGAGAWSYPYLWAQYRNPDLLWMWQIHDSLNTRFNDKRIHPIISQNLVDSIQPDAPFSPFAIGTNANMSTGLRNALGSTLFADSGVGILRGPTDTNSAELTLIWKPKGTEAGHTHANNLALDWQSPAHRWLSASGKWANYSSEIHTKWVKQTLSDNTIVVDGKSQQPSNEKVRSWQSDPTPGASAGQLLAFTNGTTFGYLRAQTDKVYPGVSLERQLVHTDAYTLDIFTAASDTSHRYDWVLHVSGTLASATTALTPGKPFANSGIAYTQLKDIQQAKLAGPTTTYWQDKGLKETLAITTFPQPDTTLSVATTPWQRRTRESLILSHTADNARFLNLWRAYAGQDPVSSVQWLNNNTEAVITLTNGETDRLILHPGGIVSAEVTPALSYRAAGLLARLNADALPQSITLLNGTELKAGGLTITTATPANWSWQQLEGNAFLLLYDGEQQAGFTLQAPHTLQVTRLNSAGQPAETITPDADGNWDLSAFSNYLVTAQGEAAPQLPVLQKTFGSSQQ